MQYKIIRGYYLTGLGQENLAYYFKVSEDQPEFKTVQTGDVAVSFYQTNEALSYLPALVRVDGIISTEKQVKAYVEAERKDGFPMLPIVEIYQHFYPLLFKKVMENCQKMHEEIKILARQTRQKGGNQ
ncbi:hypothetical protein [Streptococcus agalactiae]|uniref:Uncharacterized protein n=1 Tax=Streptococcus agalactiae MRI Z1-216 TaxID=1154879 RepID=A0AAD3A5W5_STRAG|nr:hypothetical protein [Streptococcus agalactiae]EPU31254.1 hypothetical protein SAG0161_00485 [Streptococcus agalactiae MRI Z1-213]EPU36769.1 hypothetical protein SAG0162_05750 [Streptococcus agalactiae MRI Z1-214]EPU39635.1 hypothetical protein SAG0164_06290 [Streptococcus agalactiae MRI Z1-216]EPX08838.1 hypothetical protein SAG0165_07310 [Streptococcus agalactiae MRI Z1-217]